MSAALAGTAEAGKPTPEADHHAALHSAAKLELALTKTVTALERGRVALAQERESLDWASALVDQRQRQTQRKIDVYTERRIERETQARVRTRALYKFARGGGALERMFEDGGGGRLTPTERRARGRSLRSLVEHDLALLRVHSDAQTQAADELLTATRELSALAALDSVARLQADALTLTEAQLEPALARVHEQRTALEKQLYGGDRAVREVLRAITAQRRDLARHRGLDLLAQDGLVRPVGGGVVAGFGAYQDRRLKVPMHRNGIELGSQANAKVRVIAGGEVVMVGDLPGFEQVVVVDHGGGYLSLTGRLLAVGVREGDTLAAGDVLGRAGASAQGGGVTVYLEIRHGERVVDPGRYFK